MRKPKIEGGLEIKNLELFNLTLLSKWRWRILKEPNSLWLEVLMNRYGEIEGWADVGEGGP